MKNFILLTIILMFFVVGCGPSEAAKATLTSVSSTETAALWTLTPTVTSTPTALPTLTPTPTPTPLGGGGASVIYVNSKIASSSSNTSINNIFKLNLLDPKAPPKNLTNTDVENAGYFYPAWSPDGKSIVFQKVQTISPTIIRSELFLMDENGENLQKISTVPMLQGNISVENILFDMQPAWAPDGKNIVFASNRATLLSSPNHSDIFMMDLSTYEIKKVTDIYGNSETPAFSPDGKTIAFMTDQSGNFDIWTINIDGTNLTQVTKNFAADRFPRWSPDGTNIIFHSDRTGNLEIFSVFPNGTNLTQITSNPASDATARYSPDGQWIIFQSDRGGNDDLYMIRKDGTETIKLTDSSDGEFLGDFQPK